MQQQALVVGSVIYDRPRGELRRVDDGSPVPMRPQSVRVLDLLLDHVGELVTRERIHAALWPGVIVTDDSLVQCITEIRRAIGDSRHKIVHTVPRRGYRLEVVLQNPAGSQTAPAKPAGAVPRRRIVVGLVGVVMLAALALGWRMIDAPARATVGAPDVIRPPLAVLAFRAEPTDPRMDALGTGWSEDLAATLARDADLRLVATRSSFAVNRAAGPDAVARQLGVRYLVDGRIRLVGDAYGDPADRPVVLVMKIGRNSFSKRAFTALRPPAGLTRTDIGSVPTPPATTCARSGWSRRVTSRG